MWQGASLLAATEIGGRIRAKIMALSLYGAAGALGFTGAIFGLIALLIWMSRRFTPLTASLIICGVMFGLAIVMVIAAKLQKPPKTQSSPLSATALMAAPMALKAVSSRVSFTTVAAIAAVCLGALVGRRIARD